MRTNLGTDNKKIGVSTTVLSLLSLAAILAILTSINVSAAAFSGSVGAVYIIDNSASGNNVWVYARASDGSLSSLGPVSTNGLGTGAGLGSQSAILLTSNGHWLLTVDAGSNEISVFKVQGTALTFASKASSQGTGPISLAAYGNLVYVLNAGGTGSIAGFKLSNAGVLTFIAGSNEPLSGAATPSPEQIGFNNHGNVLVVTEKASNMIDTYTVDNHGVASVPKPQASAGSGPYGFAFDNSGELIVSEAASNTVSSYFVSSQGQLRIISGAIPTFGSAPCWLLVNGHFAYTANAHGGTLSTFKVSSKGGLTLFSSVAAHTAIPALDMAFSHKSEFLYLRNGASITGFRVFSDGSISSIASISGIASSASGLAAS
ncbi:MAG: lactonase family protein [Thaumarchaeota archaeon]|nr:lactonase family protein [Nitrososphaerota archaeon]